MQHRLRILAVACALVLPGLSFAASNIGVKILVAGSGTGKGKAVNNKPRASTYMIMAEVQAGLGNRGASYQGTVAVSPGVWLYQLSGDSLALELTAKGTKYFKDEDLN